MGIFNFFRTKKSSVSNKQTSLNNSNSHNELDDKSFIKELKHFSDGTWHQYDILLDARPYGWDYMIDSAEYMNQIALENIGTVTISSVIGSQVTELIEEYHNAENNIKNMPVLSEEQGVLAIGGMSPHLHGPVKIVWINQTNVLRIFTINPDEDLVKKYVETLIRRTF